MKIATFINAHKILVTPSIVAMMWAYRNGSTDAFLYLALHGTYTLLWLMKYAIYPDRSFEERLPVWMGIAFVFLPLQAYLLAPYLLISRHVANPPYVLGAVVAIYTIGIFLHYVSDAQKYFTLRERRGLITDGFFRRVRNPNYLGEFLIYAAYAALSAHWLPWLVLAGWLMSFAVRMRRKDRSLSRYAEFEAYRAASGLILPIPGGRRESRESAGVS